jgi:hypothetical protein
MNKSIAARKIHLAFVVWAVMLSAFGCAVNSVSKSTESKESKTANTLCDPSDKTLAPYQTELLNLAFELASKIPVYPHIKDRSKSQEEVVTACLRLDQPQRAVKWAEKIENWRSGACYADAAFYYAQHNCTDQARQCLELARQITKKYDPNSQNIESNNLQWRKDVVVAKMAQAYVLLGQPQEAELLEKGITESETGKVAGTKAMIGQEQSFEQQIQSLDALVALGNFDIIKNALNAYAQLFNRFYNDEIRRSLMEEKIKSSWTNIPIFIRIELLGQLADFALEHRDQTKALDIVNQAQKFLDDYQWPVENQIPLAAGIMKLRYRAGDKQKAKRDADAMLALYNAQGKQIMDIARATALRPLAEAYQTMGNTSAAISVYKKVVDEGVQNPNSRPRAEDLSATCCSMALSEIKPDEELWTRIHNIAKRLGNPW